MPGRFQNFEDNIISETKRTAVLHRRKGVLGFSAGPQMNLRAHSVAQLQVAGDEIGMRVREEDMPDLEALLMRVIKILAHVSLRVDYCGGAGDFIGHQIRGVGQATEVILLEDQRRPLPA